MIYEIKAKSFLNGELESLSGGGWFYQDKKNADNKCKEFNQMVNSYVVVPIKLRDEE